MMMRIGKIKVGNTVKEMVKGSLISTVVTKFYGLISERWK